MYGQSVKDLIFAEGNTVPIDKFMSEALYREGVGYYMTQMPFGQDGDFITSSDISQLFGETVAVWLLQYLEMMNIAEKFVLLELGPGRGTLMCDILRVMRRFPQYDRLLEVHLVEISPVLQTAQRDTLKEAMQHREVFWHNSIADVPDMPVLVIANEFFDALPIKQFVFKGGTWCERKVCSKPEGLSVIDVVTSHLVEEHGVPEGGIVETCQAATAILTHIEGMMLRNGGACLIVDYGYLQPIYKSTIQAVKDHQYCSFLEHVGQCDISACVNFGALQKALKQVMCTVMTQREFLYRYGIRERLDVLLRNASAKQASDLRSGFLRLTENMGTLFKVLLMHSTKS
ncbi:class I SAM-dependent methyltransferase [Candidatus Anaplasma sp. TIGMIC]|uniref:class I SAM-dependent methyltransferase n=1 Tax=Candidatus Anaplasma sp. TIGMIC TaxID=3020713 RepID=UPI00232EDE86|nr:SAM-dependent methyltransferase [Candidatus Anaplasma sp. TIGMIC]MDB1135378.1 SAM-dependent methyltransferase [Candidatus Anaplasma sp. TIGMIC]